MLINDHPFCHGPFVRAFVTPNGFYRNCCATTPMIISQDVNFDTWWFDNNNFNNFRQKLIDQQSFLPDCSSCHIAEKTTNNSFRTALNKIPIKNKLEYPKEWSVMFGSVCNLACWHCSEQYSTRIESDKKRIGILSKNYKSPGKELDLRWPSFREKILESYNYHDIVTLSLLGGEPTYNKTVVDLLLLLNDNNLSKRTRLEIVTNGTKPGKLISILHQNNWNYVYIAVSIDAVGPKAEWLRYGCNWNEVDSTISYYKEHADYAELHSTVSILNIIDLPNLYTYSKDKKLKLIINYLKDPVFLSLENYDGPKIELDKDDFFANGLGEYYDLLGSKPVSGSFQQAKEYVTSLSKVRETNWKFDSVISTLMS